MLSRRRILIHGAAIAFTPLGGGFALQAAEMGRKVSPRDFGAAGDGASDDTNALKAALEFAVRENGVLFLDRWYKFSGPLHFPDHIVVRGAGLEISGLIHDGSGDAVICSLCDLDNFTIDGGRKANASRAKSVRAAILAIHGPMIKGGDFLRGVRIGTIGLRNSNYVSALALVNVADAVIADARVKDSWGHGVIVAGARNCTFKRITVEDVGNLDREGSRIGSALAIFPERNFLKEPGAWYVSGSELLTEGLTFGEVRVDGATDTAIYLHDYADRYGVSNIHFGKVSISKTGKDGFKVRDFVKDVQIDSFTAEFIGLRALVIENGVSSINVSKASISRVGYDVIADIVGQVTLNDLGTTARTITTVPAAIGIFNAKDVRVGSADISDVMANATTGKYGYGVWIRDVDHLTLNAVVRNVDVSAARIAHLTNFMLKIIPDNVSRISRDPEIVISDDGTEGSSNGELRVSGNSAFSGTDVRVSGDSSNILILGAHAPRIDAHALSEGVRMSQ